MVQPLMPKATAVWLVDNTTLTFDQIADFCNLHPLEVKGIADDEVAVGIKGQDPVASGQLTMEEIERCQKSPIARLQIADARGRRPESMPARAGAREGRSGEQLETRNSGLRRNHLFFGFTSSSQGLL